MGGPLFFVIVVLLSPVSTALVFRYLDQPTIDAMSRTSRPNSDLIPKYFLEGMGTRTLSPRMETGSLPLRSASRGTPRQINHNLRNSDVMGQRGSRRVFQQRLRSSLESMIPRRSIGRLTTVPNNFDGLRQQPNAYRPDRYIIKRERNIYRPDRHLRYRQRNANPPDRPQRQRKAYRPDRPLRQRERKAYRPDRPLRQRERKEYRPDRPLRQRELKAYRPDRPLRQLERTVYRPDRPLRQQEQKPYRPDRPLRQRERNAYRPDRLLRQREQNIYRPNKFLNRGAPRSSSSGPDPGINYQTGPGTEVPPVRVQGQYKPFSAPKLSDQQAAGSHGQKLIHRHTNRPSTYQILEGQYVGGPHKILRSDLSTHSQQPGSQYQTRVPFLPNTAFTDTVGPSNSPTSPYHTAPAGTRISDPFPYDSRSSDAQRSGSLPNKSTHLNGNIPGSLSYETNALVPPVSSSTEFVGSYPHQPPSGPHGRDMYAPAYHDGGFNVQPEHRVQSSAAAVSYPLQSDPTAPVNRKSIEGRPKNSVSSPGKVDYRQQTGHGPVRTISNDGGINGAGVDQSGGAASGDLYLPDSAIPNYMYSHNLNADVHYLDSGGAAGGQGYADTYHYQSNSTAPLDKRNAGRSQSSVDHQQQTGSQGTESPISKGGTGVDQSGEAIASEFYIPGSAIPYYMYSQNLNAEAHYLDSGGAAGGQSNEPLNLANTNGGVILNIEIGRAGGASITAQSGDPSAAGGSKSGYTAKGQGSVHRPTYAVPASMSAASEPGTGVSDIVSPGLTDSLTKSKSSSTNVI